MYVRCVSGTMSVTGQGVTLGIRPDEFVGRAGKWRVLKSEETPILVDPLYLKNVGWGVGSVFLET